MPDKAGILYARLSRRNRCMTERTDGGKSNKTKDTSKENGIDQKTNSVNMDSEQQSDPGITSYEVMEHQMTLHTTKRQTLVLAGQLVLDFAENGAPLLLLVVDTRSNALAAWSSLGRDIRILPAILLGGRRGRAARSLSGSHRCSLRLGFSSSSLSTSGNCWLGLLRGSRRCRGILGLI
jgi:hypothetical protein